MDHEDDEVPHMTISGVDESQRKAATVVGIAYLLAAEMVAVMMAAQSFDVLRILSGAEYLRVFDADRLAALARLSIGAHGAAFNVVFVFLGLGSTVFGYLWFKSGYVPKALAALGVFAPVLLGAGTFAGLIEPSILTLLSPAYMAPMFFFEVGIGVWLLVKGLPPDAILEGART